MKIFNQTIKLLLNKRKLTFVLMLILVGIGTYAIRDSFFSSADAVTDGIYYISANDGIDTSSRDGSYDQPWKTVHFAMGRGGVGHTVVFKPGVYPTFVLPPSEKGTEGAPTIVKSEVKWGARIIGSTGHGIYTGDGGGWFIIDGFEVTGARIDGIKVSSSSSAGPSIIRNNWVHHNAMQGIAMHSAKNGVIENNLIEFNGVNVQFSHGVYADGDGLIVRGNVVRSNSGLGLQLYPCIKNSVITNNVVYNHKYKGGILVSGSGNDNQGNIVTNNTMVNNVVGLSYTGDRDGVVANNLFYKNDTQLSYDENWYNIRTIVANNLLFSPTTWDTTGFSPTNTVTQDPKFVDAANFDFHLSSDSPAINAGVTRPEVTTDIDNNPRPQRDSYDIGAYEYISPDSQTSTVNLYFTLQAGTNFAAQNAVFSIFQPGTSTNAVLQKNDVTSDNSGHTSFDITPPADGNYDYKIKVNGYLAKAIKNTVFSNQINLNFRELKAGDLNNDNNINMTDFVGYFAPKYSQDIGKIPPDFNQDGIVTMPDFMIFANNYSKTGE